MALTMFHFVNISYKWFHLFRTPGNFIDETAVHKACKHWRCPSTVCPDWRLTVTRILAYGTFFPSVLREPLHSICYFPIEKNEVKKTIGFASKKKKVKRSSLFNVPFRTGNSSPKQRERKKSVGIPFYGVTKRQPRQPRRWTKNKTMQTN